MNAHQAQQQQTLARVWVPNSCPQMRVLLDGVLDLARGSAVTLQTLQDQESTMRKCVMVYKCLVYRYMLFVKGSGEHYPYSHVAYTDYESTGVCFL